MRTLRSGTVPWWMKQGIVVFFLGVALIEGGCRHRTVGPRYPAGLIGREQRVRAALVACRGCRKKSVLERRLERIHFQMAKERDDIASWRWFLAAHPKGLFSDEAGRRLMRLRFAKAEKSRSRWLWEWFLIRYGDSPLAGRAERALGDLLAANLITRPDPGKIRAYLARFPDNPHARDLRTLLEKTVFARLGPDASRSLLEAFVTEFPRSVRAEQVRRWLAARWGRRILRYGTHRDVSAFLQRFGAQSARVLEQRLIERDAREALADVDMEQLQRLSSSLSPTWRSRVQAFLQLARRARGDLDHLRKSSLDARPFRPMASVRALLLATTSSDPLAAIAAVNALRFVERAQAPRTLLLLAATGSDPLAAAAWTSLRHWVTDRAHPGARDLLEDLASDMAPGPGSSLGRARAMAMALARPGHCEFGSPAPGTPLVVLGACLASGCCRSARHIQRFYRVVRKSLSWILAQAGTERDRKPRDAAAAAVRLRVLDEFLAALSASGTGPGKVALADLRRELDARRSGLELAVTGEDKGFLLDLPFAVLHRAKVHAQGRVAAFRRICSSHRALEHEVCRVLCADERWRLDAVCRARGKSWPSSGRKRSAPPGSNHSESSGSKGAGSD